MQYFERCSKSSKKLLKISTTTKSTFPRYPCRTLRRWSWRRWWWWLCSGRGPPVSERYSSFWIHSTSTNRKWYVFVWSQIWNIFFCNTIKVFVCACSMFLSLLQSVDICLHLERFSKKVRQTPEIQVFNPAITRNEGPSLFDVGKTESNPWSEACNRYLLISLSWGELAMYAGIVGKWIVGHEVKVGLGRTKR